MLPLFVGGLFFCFAFFEPLFCRKDSSGVGKCAWVVSRHLYFIGQHFMRGTACPLLH